MRIIVLGAGVVGVATAYQLARDGHQVVVLDRAEGPGRGASFANAGLVAAGHAAAVWATPEAPRRLLRSLWRGDQAVRLRPRLSPEQWRWGARFLRACLRSDPARAAAAAGALCAFSQEVLDAVAAETGLAFDRSRRGLLYFHRDPAALEAADRAAAGLRAGGREIRRLGREETIALEPALAPEAARIAGALFAPGDESGDAAAFTAGLAARAAEMGVAFRYGERVLGLRRDGDRIAAVRTERDLLAADAVALCLGAFSARLARAAGLDLPVYPVKGYSVTLPIVDAARAPRRGGVDEDHLFAYCPMGDRLRLTATAEIGGFSVRARPRDVRRLTARAGALFGAAADFSRPTLWAGLRPATPSGLPIIDRSPISNLWLNTGHGQLGWTMANGSARLLADLIAQRAPPIDREGMRYDG